MPYGVNTPACGGLGQPRCGGSIDNILNGGNVGLGSVWSFPNTTNSSGSVIIPQTTVTNSGAVVNSTVLDKTLNAVLAGLALLKGANKIPTTLDVNNGYDTRGYTQADLYALQNQSAYRSDGTTLGKVENYVKNNTGVVAIGALIVAALFLDPFAKGKKR